MYISSKYFYMFLINEIVLNCVYCEKEKYIGCYNKLFNENKLFQFNETVESCVDVCEENFFRYAVLSQNRCKCLNTIISKELNLTDCNVKCNEIDDKYCGGTDAESYYDTDIKVPGPVRQLMVNESRSTETSISLHWDPPELDKILSKYIIEANIIKTYADYMINTPTWIFDSSTKQAELVNLHPGTTYEFKIKSASDFGDGGVANITASTIIGTPDPIPENPEITEITETTLTILINQATNTYGPINWYIIIVHYAEHELTVNFDEKLLKTYQEAQNDGTPYYITAKLNYENRTKKFIVGDGSTYQGYFNAPLIQDKHIHISIGVVSVMENITKSRYSIPSHYEEKIQVFHYDERKNEDSSNSTMVTILTVACVIFGILLIGSIIAFVYIRHKVKTSRGLHRLSDNHEMILQGPVTEMENNGYVYGPEEQGNFEHKFKIFHDKLYTEQKISRNNLTLDIDHIIGTGNFGDVIKGNLNQNNIPHSCQAHIISDDMEKQTEKLFFQTSNNLLTLLPHKNLINFYGVCKTTDWIYFVMEDVPFTLKKHILVLREKNITNNSVSLEENILRIIIELVEVMEYLSTKNIVHKQLCAHNINLTTNYELKLSIFGPTLNDDQGKHIDLSRWQAPEVLKYQNYSTKSDVWSFGCLIWELCCLGGTLYPNLNSPDLLSRIKNGARPEQPTFVYDDLYQLLLNCWELDQNERPSFQEIKVLLNQFLLTSPKHAFNYECNSNGQVTVNLPYYLPLLEISN